MLTVRNNKNKSESRTGPKRREKSEKSFSENLATIFQFSLSFHIKKILEGLKFDYMLIIRTGRH